MALPDSRLAPFAADGLACAAKAGNAGFHLPVHPDAAHVVMGDGETSIVRRDRYHSCQLVDHRASFAEIVFGNMLGSDARRRSRSPGRPRFPWLSRRK